jgi:oligopeptide transport system ATP-binding protein
MPPILQVRGLTTHFHTTDGIVHAVNGISFDLDEGETLAIVGESGCGKTVSMLSLLGLIPRPPGKIEAGEALLRDGDATRDLLSLDETELRKVRGAQIGFIFQDPMTSLNPVLTIGLQISEALVQHGCASQAEARQATIRLLEQVGISDAETRYMGYPHQFSGGMRQRAMIAMAVACHPRILIADEPTTALDVTIQAQILDLIKRLRQELHLAVIWITHDLGVVAGLADRVVVMYGGTVVEQAPVDALYGHPQHPYTLGLLRAVPRLDQVDRIRLENIEGVPPDLLQPLRHCPFAWRCSYVFDRCWQAIPPLASVDARHVTACFYDVEHGRPRHAG